MKKMMSLFLFLVCVTHPVSFAEIDSPEDSAQKGTASDIAQDPSLVEESEITSGFYNESDAAEIYDFLAAEIASKREDWDSAKTHYDSLIAKNSDPALLERRIQLDLAEGNIAEALPFIQKLIVQDPTNLANYNLLAEAYLLTGDFEYAARTYNHLVEMIYLNNNGALETTPYFAILKKFHEFELSLEDQLTLFKHLAALEEYDAFPHVLLAGFLIDNSRFSEAESYLERALQLNPDNAKIYTLYTYIYWNEGRPDKAIALLEEAYGQYFDPEIGLELANALITNFEYEDAYQHLVRLMISTNEAPVVFEKFIGMAYVMGNYDNILNMLELRLDQPEVLTRAVLNLFYFSEILGNSEALLKVLPEIEDPTPEYAEAIYTIKAKIALLEGDYLRFNDYFESIASLETMSEAGIALKKMLMLQEAKKYDLLDQELAKKGDLLKSENSAYLAFLKSMSAFGHKNYEQMIEILQEEIRNNPQDAIAYNALGYSLVEIDPKNAKMALPFISKANLMMPGQDFIEDSLAWTYYQLGDLQRAKKYIVKAYHKNKDPEIIAHYIVILEALGQTEKAKDLYHKFDLFFGNSDIKEVLSENVEWVD